MDYTSVMCNLCKNFRTKRVITIYYYLNFCKVRHGFLSFLVMISLWD